jgi:transcriptional repressor NrdR
MICPECGSDQLSCINSRPALDCVKRRRECIKCGHRFSTVEISVDRFTKLQAREAKLRHLAGILQGLVK